MRMIMYVVLWIIYARHLLGWHQLFSEILLEFFVVIFFLFSVGSYYNMTCLPDLFIIT